jgi:hypothetical protein
VKHGSHKQLHISRTRHGIVNCDNHGIILVLLLLLKIILRNYIVSHILRLIHDIIAAPIE